MMATITQRDASCLCADRQLLMQNHSEIFQCHQNSGRAEGPSAGLVVNGSYAMQSDRLLYRFYLMAH